MGGRVKKKICPDGLEIQTVLFNKEKFTPRLANTWLGKYKLSNKSIDESENKLRYRQADPEDFKKDSFRTIEITKNVSIIVACPKEETMKKSNTIKNGTRSDGKKLMKKGGVATGTRTDEAYNGYVAAVLFSSNDDDDQPLDYKYSRENINKSTEKTIRKMLDMYFMQNGSAIERSGLDAETIGMDIWYAQAGHGVGFFDHNLGKAIEEQLTKGAKKYGDLSVHVFAQDGEVYVEGIKLKDTMETGGAAEAHEQDDMTALKKLIDKFSEIAPAYLNLDKKLLIENSEQWTAGGAVSFNSIKLSVKESKLKVGEGSPERSYLMLSSDINQSGVGDGKEPAVARTYTISFEIKGKVRYTQRRTEEGTLFKFYIYSRTISDLLEQFESEQYRLKAFADQHNIKFIEVLSNKMERGGGAKPTRTKLPAYKHGGAVTSPNIYVVSLSDYNEGKTYGKHFNFSDYADGETLQNAIYDFLDEVKDEHGGEKREEYGVHDYEGFPKMYYSESMDQKSFDDVYEFLKLAETIPADALEGFVDYGHELSDAEEAYQGEYKNEEDFTMQLVDDIGGPGAVSTPEYYLYVSDTDRRIIAGEEGDNYVENIRDEDDGERLIEEADLSVEDFRAAKKKVKETMTNEAEEIIKQKIYDEWHEGLNDPFDFLVNVHGIYSAEDLGKASFVQFDYEKFARDLLINDYFSVEEHGSFYVFRRM